MKRMLLIFFACLYLPTALAEAHESTRDYRVLKEINSARYEAAVIVREDGHLLGQPYQVELRVNCEGSQESPMQWKVFDSFSVCDLSPESLVMNKQKTAIALKTKMADLKNFDDQMDLGISSPQVQCEEKTSVKKFSLRNLCGY